MKWVVKGDVDGFFGLGLNNFINFLLIINLSHFVLGFPMDLIAYRILPGMALGLLFGNLFYAWQAKRLGESTGRTDVCAIPYGINLLPIFFHVFYIMLPAQQIALSAGADVVTANDIAWKAGVLACFGSGLIEIVGSFFVPYLRKIAPRAALLSALAVIGIFFISADYFFRAYAFPIIGIPTLILVLYFYYGGVKIKYNIPGGLIVLAIGIVLAWGTYWMGMDSPIANLKESDLKFGFYFPWFYGIEALSSLVQMLTYSAIIIPMGLLNVVGSLQAIESAAAAGDEFEPRSTLAVNGAGSIIAGLLGSPFPTTIYIGHPGWKAIGARAGYSLINGVVFSLLCLTGAIGILSEFIPIEAGMAILIWIGFTIGAQAFQAVPKAHAPAVIAGIIPGVGAFSALIMKRVLGSTGYGTEALPYSDALLAKITTDGNLFSTGVFALEQGWLYTSILLTSTMVAIIDKRFHSVIGWLLAGATLSAIGIIHNFRVLETDITTQFGPAWQWVAGYLIAVIVVYLTRLLFIERSNASPSESSE